MKREAPSYGVGATGSYGIGNTGYNYDSPIGYMGSNPTFSGFS
jgi:hypothetical protein